MNKNIIDQKKVEDLFDSIYPFTTENISGYYNLYDFKGKDILTVGASGDHTINLALKDPNSVDYFDINCLSKHYYNLKCAALLALTLKEFIEFFSTKKGIIKNKKLFNESTYSKIREYLDKESKEFWDNLFSKNKGYDIRVSSLFSDDEPSIRKLKIYNSYLTEKKYNEAKSKIVKYKPRFINCNITDLRQNITQKYDYIMFSNIPQFLEDIYKENHLEEFKKLVLELEEVLKDDGKIFMSYLYAANDVDFSDPYRKIYNYKEVKKMFGKNYKKHNFRTFPNDSDYDSLLVYKKTAK